MVNKGWEGNMVLDLIWGARREKIGGKEDRFGTQEKCIAGLGRWALSWIAKDSRSRGICAEGGWAV